MLQRLKDNWFLPGLVVALALGALLSGAGDVLNPDGRTQQLFVLLFIFMVGFTLPSEQIVHGIKNVKLHLAAQLLRRRAVELAAGLRKWVSTISGMLLLLIVFFTISSAADNPQFVARIVEFPVPFAFLAVSHGVFIAGALAIGRMLGLSRPDRISLVYLGPQKTMVVGVPLLTVYFSGRPEVLAFAILPLLFYHPFQILTAGIIRSILGRYSGATQQT